MNTGLLRILLTLTIASVLGLGGCRGYQTAQIVKPGDKEMVGSHVAGAETFGPLVDTAVGNLLARHHQGVMPTGFTDQSPSTPLRICFVGIENQSAEELGDFKIQLYQQIDTRIQQSQVYQSVSQRYVEAGLRQCRLRPDELMIPANMRTFSEAMERQGQPFDYMLYATITSGTTQANKDYQRSYLLTLEMLNLRTGQSDKESAELTKQYNVSPMAKIKGLNPLK